MVGLSTITAPMREITGRGRGAVQGVGSSIKNSIVRGVANLTQRKPEQEEQQGNLSCIGDAGAILGLIGLRCAGKVASLFTLSRNAFTIKVKDRNEWLTNEIGRSNKAYGVRRGCCGKIFTGPRALYHKVTIFNLPKPFYSSDFNNDDDVLHNVSSGNYFKHTALFMLTALVAPVATQRGMAVKAAMKFGEFKNAKGFCSSLSKLTQTELLQGAVFANYAWTIITSPVAIPVELGVAAILKLASAAVKKIWGRDPDDDTFGQRGQLAVLLSKKLNKKAEFMAKLSGAHFYGVPRAVFGLGERAFTSIIYVPAYGTLSFIGACFKKCCCCTAKNIAEKVK